MHYESELSSKLHCLHKCDLVTFKILMLHTVPQHNLKYSCHVGLLTFVLFLFVMCCRRSWWEGLLHFRRRWFPCVWTHTVLQRPSGTSQSQRANTVSSTLCHRTTSLFFFSLPSAHHKKADWFYLSVYAFYWAIVFASDITVIACLS